MLERFQIQDRGLAFLILGFPSTLVIFMLMNTTTPVFLQEGVAATFFILITFVWPAIGGLVLGWRRRLWAIPLALLYFLSGLISSAVVIGGDFLMRPEAYDEGEAGFLLLMLFLIAAVGTMVAAVAGIVSAAVRWVWDAPA